LKKANANCHNDKTLKYLTLLICLQLLKIFVKEPLTNYKKAPELLKHHASTQYHLLATEKIYAIW